jgi:hypothetical protein
LLRALVRLRPDFTSFGAEVGVDGFDGKRLFVRVAGRSYAVWKVRGGPGWRSFWDVTRRGFHISTPEPRCFTHVGYVGVARNALARGSRHVRDSGSIIFGNGRVSDYWG